MTRKVHTAKQPDQYGYQRCVWCDVVLTEPGLTPFQAGSSVEVTEGPGGRVSVLTKASPTCSTVM